MTQITVKDANGDAVAVELPVAVGRAAADASKPIVMSNEDLAAIGALTETAPSTDTASSGLNGRLQRIAQRLTSLIALFPTTLGTKTAANSLAVTLASDDAALASLGVMDDWDESDRAKVNLIVGQAGVAAGAGAVSATVQRLTLASDDPAVATLGAISGAAVITDANGTIQQYLRGLVKQWIAGTLVIGDGTHLIGKVKTKFIEAVAATMTRPNDTNAYVANDAIANNTTAGSVTPFSFSMSDVNDDLVTIERLRLITSDTGVAGKALRMWLFRASPTVGAGDNAAFSNPRATFIGSLSGTMRTFSDGSGGIFVPDEGSRIITLPTSGAKTVFGLLQTLEAIASPLAQSTWIATLEGFQGSA
ncbi:hypothetical protein [Mesorhizobium sp.]|uniref:hypothetical protein n=1 Tax=Mesorhizobium sp. TaxID=1871066 RepID=UPI0012076C5B|nr:hypothetical protein [Mesorhizobium sp.]TIX28935.1 MAG: hypothetical protein E5V35_00825 [Mesorhizobium sp.]